MHKNVSLTLTGRQRSEGAEETVTELRVTARYIKRNDSHYFLYEEMSEESGAVIQNTLKLKGGVLELVKRGAVSTRMVFDAGKEYLTSYSTPYGSLPMELYTEKLETVFLEDMPKEIRAVYSLSSEGQLFAECILNILVSQD